MERTIPNNDYFNTIDMIDDEIDTALLNDNNFNEALDSIKNNDYFVNEEDELIDTNIEYTDAGLDMTAEDIDANDIIAAERDIAINPFEDDEIVDAAVGSDNIDIDDIDIKDLADIEDDDI